jgi:hypothetical protein
MIIACLTGLVGNSTSVLVYLSKAFRKKSIGTYFAALGFAEMFFLASNVIFVLQPL